MKTHRALTVYAFAALLCSFSVEEYLLSAPLLKADDTIVLTTTDLPQGYRLVADTGFQTREMALVTGEKEKHQPYTVRERRQDVALPRQTDADGARISVTMMVFPSVELAMAYCEQMEVYVFEGGTLCLDPQWHTSRNDLGDPRLTGKGGAVRSDPVTLLIRYGNVFCQISAGSFNLKYSEAVALLGKIWLEKISKAPAETVAVGEGSTKPDVTGGPQGIASSMNIDNDFVRVKIDPNRACVTNLTFKRGSNAELIASNWGSYLIDLGTDPRLGKYLKEGWVVEKVEHQANYSKFLFRHPSGFVNEMLLSWGEGGVEVRCDITAPESVEISGVLRPGGGWEGGRDKWAFPTMEGIKTGSFTYPGPHIPLYPPDHSWGTPTENWIALWDDQVNEVYGFTFSGGSKAKICNGAGTDQHILIPEGTSRVSFHIVKPKPGTPYEAIRALINAPSTLIGRQTGKPEGYHLSEGKPQGATGGAPAGTGHVKSFAGRWNTNWGLMEITVVGNKVYGHYEHDQGKIEGTLSADGRTVEGIWSEAPTYKPPKDSGKFRLTLSDDGDSFTASWGYGDSATGGSEIWKGTRIKGKGEPQGATGRVPAGIGRQDAYHLSGGDSSVPLNARYQPADGFLRLELRFSKPGSVLDTVGINPAKAGDFAIWILPDNVLVWQIYHPGIASNVRAPNGWHILRSQGNLQPERWYSVEVTWGKRGARLVIDGKVHAQVDVNLPLSGSKVFLGDFPGDAQWAPRYEVNRSFTGDVRNIVFGP